MQWGDLIGLDVRVIDQIFSDPDYESFLIDLYGEVELSALRELRAATQQSQTRRGNDVTVFMLPGITGSSLGNPDSFWNPFDIIWIKASRIGFGHLEQLKYPDTNKEKIVSHGLLMFGYTRFCLTLNHHFQTVPHHYDWRRPLDDLGKDLANAIEAHPSDKVVIVAHSMGGMVTRAALAHSRLEKVKKVITLGTPHHGSFSPVRAIRGTNRLLRKVAKYIPGQSAEDIADRAMKTMPGFYDLLPFKSFFGDQHLFDKSRWPENRPSPMSTRLENADRYQRNGIAPADPARFTSIIGRGHKTLVGAHLVDGRFDFDESLDGDGAVPFASAHPFGIENGDTYYTYAEHGAMPGDRDVLDAVIALVNNRPVTSLRKDPPQLVRAGIVTRSEADLVDEIESSLDEAEGEMESLKLAMSEFIRVDEPARAARPSASSELEHKSAEATSSIPPLSRFGRTKIYHATSEPEKSYGRTFELRIMSGDIQDADCRAYAFGIYEGVPPGGAAHSLDPAVDGQINEMFERGMLDARVGGVAVLPVARRLVRAEFVIAVGLGRPGQTEESIAAASQNLVRYLIKARAEDCAIVLMGTHSGFSTTRSLRGILTGCFKAISDEPDSDHFRGITICEYDESKFDELRVVAEAAVEEAARAAPGTDLTIHQKMFKGAKAEEERRALVSHVKDSYKPSIFLTAELNEVSSSELELSLNILGDSSLASTQKMVHIFDRAQFERIIAGIYVGRSPGTRDNLLRLSDEINDFVLSDEMKEALARTSDLPIVVQLNPLATRIPWELIQREQGTYSAIEVGISRHLRTHTGSVSKYTNARRHSDDALSVLIIGDPTSDLSGALSEATNIYNTLNLLIENPADLKFLKQGEATRANILGALDSGRFDMIHYAGHAAFNEGERWRSGIKCADGAILNARDLAGLSQLPAVMIFNACESAMVRSAQERQQVDFQGSFAEAAITAGISHYIGTYWQVGDADAASFAEVFYAQMMSGRMIGDAIVEARNAIYGRPGSVDWLNYIHYGNRLFRMKIR